MNANELRIRNIVFDTEQGKPDTIVFGLYARWRLKALTLNLELMMIEAQMFNLLLHRHWRKTRVTGWCGLVAQTFNYAQK